MVSRLFDLVAFGPVVFHMLQEFAVPGCVGLVAVAPVYDELGQQRPGEFGVDVRHAQDVEDIFRGLPVVGNALGFSAVLQAGAVFRPLDTDVLDKFRVQLLRRRTPFAPVQDELRYRFVDKLPVDAAALHDLQGIQAGAPAVVQPGGRGAESLGLALLVVAPVANDMLAEFVFPGVAGFTALAPVIDEILQLVEGELARDVVVEGQQLQHVLARPPVQRQQAGAAAGGRGKQGGRPRRAIRLRHPLVESEHQAFALRQWRRAHQQYTLVHQAAADALQILDTPEGQEAQQQGALHAEPGVAAAQLGAEVVEKSLQLLQQNGLPQPYRRRQGRREHELAFGDQG